MTFVKRQLQFIITLASGNFAGTSGNVLTLPPLRATTKIVKAGGASMGKLQASIYGMTFSHMNQLSTLGQQIQLIARNKITVLAGDAKAGMSIVFQGTITDAYGDFNSAPNVPMQFTAAEGAAEAVATIPATSYKGSVDINTVMAGFAKQIGYVYETSVPASFLPNVYYSGAPFTQIRACAEAYGVACSLDNGILAVWPRTGARNSTPTVVSPTTGMIAYPSFTAQGIKVQTTFNPAIRFASKIQVKSSLPAACGIWSVFTMEHDLDSQEPNGKWQSTLGCYNPANPTPPVTY